MRQQFLAQGGAIDAERLGGATLVAAAPAQDFRKQRHFHFAQQQCVETLGTGCAVEIRQVAPRAARHAFMQRGGAGGFDIRRMQRRYRIQGRGFHVSCFAADSALRTGVGECSAVFCER